MFGGILFYIIAFNISISAFRGLVDYQFQNFYHLWEQDGRPTGGKVTRGQLHFVSSDLSSMICGIKWAIGKPEWLDKESDAEKRRKKMVRWFFISLIGFFSGSGGMLLFGRTLSKAG